MFNVLAWNIQFFTIKRIDDNSGTTSVERAANAERTLANLMYIITTVEQSGADIFVVIEPRSSQGAVQQLAGGGGPTGLLYLLAQLREWMPNRKWCLVPPLRLNPRDIIGQISTYTECIGVFWSDLNLQFTGPNVWPAGNANGSGPPIAPNTGATANYPAPWNAAVPKNLQAAGQCRFFDGNKEILFPQEYNRRPFFTTFRERNAPQRTLRLFTMHTSPGTARDGLANMVDVSERIPGDGEVSLIIGDLNVNLNQMDSSAYATIQYFATQDRFGILFPPMVNNIFYPTRVLSAPNATPAAYLTRQLLDYGFVRWGPNGRQNASQSSVVDRVAAVPKPLFSSEISPELAKWLTMIDVNLRDQNFRLRWAYGHIAQPARNDEIPDSLADGTSDHLPILVSV